MTTDPRVHGLRLAEFQVPSHFRATQLSTLEDSDEKSVCQDWVDNLRDHYVTDRRPLEDYPEDPAQIGRGLLLMGPPGTGKTTLATATLLEVYHAQRLAVFWLACADYMELHIERMSLENRREPGAVDRWYQITSTLEDAVNAPVLLLDDVGKEHRTKSGYAEGKLDMMLRTRHRSSRPTIVTSNLRPKEWGTLYNPSMGSFVHEAFTHVEVVREDRRG